MLKILITGGSGFIAKWLVDSLVSIKNVELHVLYRQKSDQMRSQTGQKIAKSNKNGN